MSGWDVAEKPIVDEWDVADCEWYVAESWMRCSRLWMRCSRGARVEHLTANAEVATVLGVQSQHPPTQWNLRGGRLKQCWIEYIHIKIQKSSSFCSVYLLCRCGWMSGETSTIRWTRVRETWRSGTSAPGRSFETTSRQGSRSSGNCFHLLLRFSAAGEKISARCTF